jgi:plastocyanin
MTRSRFFRTVIAVAAAAAIWACGGGYTSPSSMPGGASATIINIVGHNGAQSFSPNPASVRQGDMVVWHNADNLPHHIVLNDSSLDTGDIPPGASSSAQRLAVNGANYHCTIHPTEIGGINAASGAPPPCQGPYC